MILNINYNVSHHMGMSQIYVQELTIILGPQNPTQGRCVAHCIRLVGWLHIEVKNEKTLE